MIDSKAIVPDPPAVVKESSLQLWQEQFNGRVSKSVD